MLGKKLRRGAVAGLMLISSLTAIETIAPTAASAATQYCATTPDQSSINNKTIALPGKPDIRLTVVLCFYNEVGFYQTVEWINWNSTADLGTRFNDFVAKAWVQKSNVNKCTGTEYPSVNSYNSGSTDAQCSWKSADTSGMSGDGEIVYDVADDGLGAFTWNLTGTS